MNPVAPVTSVLLKRLPPGRLIVAAELMRVSEARDRRCRIHTPRHRRMPHRGCFLRTGSLRGRVPPHARPIRTWPGAVPRRAKRGRCDDTGEHRQASSPPLRRPGPSGLCPDGAEIRSVAGDDLRLLFLEAVQLVKPHALAQHSRDAKRQVIPVVRSRNGPPLLTSFQRIGLRR